MIYGTAGCVRFRQRATNSNTQKAKIRFFLKFLFCLFNFFFFVSFFKSKTVTQTRITVLFHFVFSFILPAGSYSLCLLYQIEYPKKTWVVLDSNNNYIAM